MPYYLTQRLKGALEIKEDGAKNVPASYTVERKEYRLFGWHFATVYKQCFCFKEDHNNCIVERWLYIGPNGLGFGITTPKNK